jgi:hypothetical protein
MKKILLSISVLTIILLSSCNKTKNTKHGDVLFWQQTGSGFGITTVNFNGQTSYITQEFGSAPSCGGITGCANYIFVETGTYNFTATDGTYNWSGSVTVTEDGCSTQLLE